MVSAHRSPAFRWIASVYTASVVLEWLSAIALMVMVFEHTGSTIATAALLLCKQVVPGVLIPLSVRVLDGLPHARSFALAAVLQAAAVGGLALTTAKSPAIYPLACLAGVSGGLMRALLRAAIARSVELADLPRANARLNALIGIAGLVGPASAAALVGFAGGVVSLAVSAAGLVGLTLAASWFPAARDGAAEIGAAAPEVLAPRPAHPSLSLPSVLCLVGFVMCVFSMDDPTLLAYSERSLGAGVGGYGAIVFAWGVGIALGSLLFTRLTHVPMLRIYLAATSLAAMSYLVMSVSPSIGLTVAIAVLGGLGNGMDWVAIVTLVQQATPPGQEARAAASLEAVATAAPGFGIILGGVLAEVVTPRVTLAVPGALALVALAVALIYLRLAVRGGRRTGPVFVPSIHGGSA